VMFDEFSYLSVHIPKLLPRQAETRPVGRVFSNLRINKNANEK
jgi:hypothetical protein